MRFMAYGRIEVFVGDEQVRRSCPGGWRANYAVDLNEGTATPVDVAIRISTNAATAAEPFPNQ
jgi:hypothetical protein